jgi:hypothetical protein
MYFIPLLATLMSSVMFHRDIGLLYLLFPKNKNKNLFLGVIGTVLPVFFVVSVFPVSVISISDVSVWLQSVATTIVSDDSFPVYGGGLSITHFWFFGWKPANRAPVYSFDMVHAVRQSHSNSDLVVPANELSHQINGGDTVNHVGSGTSLIPLPQNSLVPLPQRTGLSTHRRGPHNPICFNEWLVGFTDGDGCFSISKPTNKPWVYSFSISQSSYNARVLLYINQRLGVGHITNTPSIRDARGNPTTGLVFRVQGAADLKRVIFPIFDAYPCHTTKLYDYLLFREAVMDPAKAPELKPKFRKRPWDYQSNHVTVPTKSWILGFIEAEGSFFVTSAKQGTKYHHGFSIGQKNDREILELLKRIFQIDSMVTVSRKGAKIPKSVTKKVEPWVAVIKDPTSTPFQVEEAYVVLKYLVTTNSYLSWNLATAKQCTIEHLIQYFEDSMIGMKAVEHRIWSSAYKHHRGDYAKLREVKDLLQDMRANKPIYPCQALKKARPGNEAKILKRSMGLDILA